MARELSVVAGDSAAPARRFEQSQRALRPQPRRAGSERKIRKEHAPGVQVRGKKPRRDAATRSGVREALLAASAKADPAAHRDYNRRRRRRRGERSSAAAGGGSGGAGGAAGEAAPGAAGALEAAPSEGATSRMARSEKGTNPRDAGASEPGWPEGGVPRALKRPASMSAAICEAKSS